jgi:hypothetical protein
LNDLLYKMFVTMKTDEISSCVKCECIISIYIELTTGGLFPLDRISSTFYYILFFKHQG